MPFTAEDSVAISETVSGDGTAVTSAFEFNPRELFEFMLERTDVGSNVWNFEVEASTNGVRWASFSNLSLVLLSTDPIAEVSVVGKKFVRLRGVGSGGDIFAGTVYWVRDGGF